MSARDLMQAGLWYNALDPDLETLRQAARRAVHAHGQMPPDVRGAMAPELRALLGHVGDGVWIEAPFHCAYGFNIHLGDSVYLNAGVTILDSAPVRIGTRSMLGPGVQIACADHHRDPVRRAAGEEIAHPVTLGADVWIGAGAILLPGVTIGDAAIVAAGAVVTRDVAAGTTAKGVPAG